MGMGNDDVELNELLEENASLRADVEVLKTSVLYFKQYKIDAEQASGVISGLKAQVEKLTRELQVLKSEKLFDWDSVVIKDFDVDVMMFL